MTADTPNTDKCDLVDALLDVQNIRKAIAKVQSSKGAPGVDGMTVHELGPYSEEHLTEISMLIRSGRYRPQPVRRVEIPKPDGGTRNLGVPTVKDRVVQQAIAQVLQPIFTPTFSESSYGFIEGRSAHDAVNALKQYANEGYIWTVDIDLSKYFDTIAHDLLVNMIREQVKDKAVVELVKRFLKSGVAMPDGLIHPTETGSPQGGNLSPLLANIYLTRFDDFLEERDHRFVRYADDIMIVLRSERAAERVMSSSVEFLEKKLKLKVNEEKSTVAQIFGLKYLGFTLFRNMTTGKADIGIHDKTMERMKDKLREILTKNWPISMADTLRNLTVFYRGWINYYGLAMARAKIARTVKWARRKVRAKYLKQWKRTYRRGKNLQKIYAQASEHRYALNYRTMWKEIKSGIGLWRLANSHGATAAMTNRYLELQGFPDMLEMYDKAHERLANRPLPAGTVGGVRGQ
jgi:RNA-directed DNA polymerase